MRPWQFKTDIERFIAHGLWRVQPRVAWKHRAVTLLRYVVMIVRNFNRDNCFTRAGALAYTTIFAIVPLLAILFAMLGAFAPFRQYEDKIMDFVIDQIMPPVQDKEQPPATQDAAKYIKGILLEKQEVLREASTALGAVGMGLLVLSIISVMATVEKAFNQIWRVDKPRSLLYRVIYYWSLTIVPILVVISLGFAASLTSSSAAQWLKTLPVVDYIISHGIFTFIIGYGTPLLLMWVAFTALYIYMPNTTVRLDSAMVGGGVAAVLFEAAKWANFIFSSKFIAYSVLYGAFAALPIFLVWIYFVWAIVLLGAEVSYAWQNIETYAQLERLPRVSQAEREKLAIRLLAWICARFYAGQPAPKPSEMSAQFNVAAPLISELCHAMVPGGVLTEIRNGEPRYQPARALGKITVKDVIDCLRRGCGEEEKVEVAAEDRIVIDIFNRGEAAADQVYASTTYEEIAKRLASGLKAEV